MLSLNTVWPFIRKSEMQDEAMGTDLPVWHGGLSMVDTNAKLPRTEPLFSHHQNNCRQITSILPVSIFSFVNLGLQYYLPYRTTVSIK